jgi:thioredoxin reductase
LSFASDIICKTQNHITSGLPVTRPEDGRVRNLVCASSMLLRSGKLSDTISRYLLQRIEENPAIELHYRTEFVGLAGDTHLERIAWRDKVSGNTSDHEIRHVFIMAGASPRTEWLTLSFRPVSGFVIVTMAPGTTALVASRTWPATALVVSPGARVFTGATHATVNTRKAKCTARAVNTPTHLP